MRRGGEDPLEGVEQRRVARRESHLPGVLRLPHRPGVAEVALAEPSVAHANVLVGGKALPRANAFEVRRRADGGAPGLLESCRPGPARGVATPRRELQRHILHVAPHDRPRGLLPHDRVGLAIVVRDLGLRPIAHRGAVAHQPPHASVGTGVGLQPACADPRDFLPEPIDLGARADGVAPRGTWRQRCRVERRGEVPHILVRKREPDRLRRIGEDAPEEADAHLLRGTPWLGPVVLH
jgi:hypothetical protein